MEWMTSRSQLGHVRVGTEGGLIVLSASPSQPGSNHNEPNRGGGESFEDQKLNHRRRKDNLGARGDGGDSRHSNRSACYNQSVSQGRQTHGHVNRIYAFDPYLAVRCAITFTRREFVQAAASATAAGLLGCSPNGQPRVAHDELAYATLRSRSRKPTGKVSRGVQPLRLGTGRDGFLYVPPSYSPEKATPLVVLLHGAGRHSSDWSSPRFAGLFDDPPIIVIAPDSRKSTWDVLHGGYGPDVRFIDESLDLVFGMCNVDPAHIALGGFSDGASYALSLGLANGDLFNALIAFSPGFNEPATKRGKPRIFVAHGRQDQVLAIDATSRPIVRALRADGYEVEYEEFEGRHTVTADEVVRAMRWFVGR